MNLFLFLFLPLLSLAEAPSEAFMSVVEQTAYIDAKAKEFRRSYHIRNYEDVSSGVRWMSRTDLDKYISDKDTYENFLNKDEVSSLYRCVAKENCELYLVTVSATYHGGYGQEANFVLLYTQSKKSFTISHTLYAE